MLGNLARPVWGWGRGVTPRPTPLFFGSATGGKTGCILYTILGSARRHGLNEFDYLVDLLDRLSDLPAEAELFNMLPDRWTPRKP
jgi:hypothetical protein